MADPGFPRRGGGEYQPQRWGQNPILLVNCSRKLHENKKKLTIRWGAPPRRQPPSLAPAMSVITKLNKESTDFERFDLFVNLTDSFDS